MRVAVCCFALVLAAGRVHAQIPNDWLQFNARQQATLELERAAQGAGSPAPIASPFAFDTTTGQFIREADGSISAVGEIQNVTDLTLTFPVVSLTYFNGNAELGTAATYAFAPQNVRLQASKLYVGAMPPGSVAFYKIYSNLPYDSVTRWTGAGSAQHFSVTPSAATVSVTSAFVTPSSVWTGRVLNGSSRALTYFTQVAVEGFKNGKIADVSFTYVSGLSIACGSTAVKSGVGPGGTAPFTYFFLHPVATVGRAHVTWDEFALSGSTAVAPAAGGPASISVTASCPWTASSDVSWITITSGGAGSADATVTYVVSPNSQPTSRVGTISIKGIPYRITQSGFSAPPPVDAAPPFGAVDTPLADSIGVTGSIAVTGWALDDTGVSAVRIFRSPVGAEAPGQLVFVGDGVLIDGARPDVATQYPGFPNSTRAGWGYLMLTNTLPNRGNGVFTLHIYAEDAAGRSTLLGSRTITCTNDSATTPFGAIDTPGQGQTVSGIVNNFGWVLSPGTRRADPPGGGSVTVFVDGAPVGTPSQWTGRSDLAALFPAEQYHGVGSALGVFSLNTATLTNGVHTIAWGVTDTDGGVSGIGSRYFTVANGAGAAASPPAISAAVVGSPGAQRLTGRRGADLDAAFEPLPRDATGVTIVAAEELDRIEIRVRASRGHLRTAMGDLPLPIGSRIDAADGSFAWQVGPGFIGAYDLVFATPTGSEPVRISVYPRGTLTRPQVIIDRPGAGEQVPGSFDVSGWAVDPRARHGNGIETIHVWAYPQRGGIPLFLGVTSPEHDRPDVAAIHGARGLKSGYRLIVDSLPPGRYELALFGWSATEGRFLHATTRQIVIR